MKRALLLPVAALLLPVLAPPAPARERHVPLAVEEDGREPNFYERWFGNQLRATREPILSRAGDRGRFVSRLRLLVLPSFHPGYAIRIDESEGGGLVSFVELSGAGGYAPGRVRRRANSRMSAAAMRDLRRLVEQSGLASAPTHPPPPELVQTPEGPRYFASFDGTAYVLELVDRGGNRFVHRNRSQLSPALRALVSELESLRPAARRPAIKRP